MVTEPWALFKSAADSLLCSATRPMAPPIYSATSPPLEIELAVPKVPILANADQRSGHEKQCHRERGGPLSTADRVRGNS